MEYELVSVLPFRRKWRAEFCIKENGRRIRHARIRKVIDAHTEAEARAIAATEAKTLTMTAPDDMAELVRAYACSLPGCDVTDETRAGYRKAARRAVEHFKERPLRCDSFAVRDAKEYVRDRLSDGASPNTVRQEISVMRMALRSRGLADPFDEIGLPTRPKCELSENQTARVEGLLERIEGPMGLAAWLAYGCRLRTGEIAALHTDDAPYDENVLFVRNVVGQDGALRLMKRTRQIQLTGEALRRLRMHQVAYLHGSGYLLGTPHTPANPQVLARRWGAIVQAAGLDVTLNGLRALGGVR